MFLNVFSPFISEQILCVCHMRMMILLLFIISKATLEFLALQEVEKF